jgi:hypothetical protein
VDEDSDAGESDLEFLTRLDRQTDQAHREIAAVYDRARRAALGEHAAQAHTDWGFPGEPYPATPENDIPDR